MRSPRGMTLLEVMVTVAILAMTTALVYGSLSITLSSQANVRRVTDRYHAGRVALMKISHDLTCAFLSKHVSVLEKNRETLFIGKSDEVTFTYLGHYTFEVKDEPTSDQGVVTYELGYKDGQKVLLRREKTVIDDQPDKGGVEEVLAEGVKDIEFEYYDEEQEDWTDDWKAEMNDMDPVITDKTLEKQVNTAKVLSGQAVDDPEFMLPKRVRIKLILEDSEGEEYTFQTETYLPLRYPFNW